VCGTARPGARASAELICSRLDHKRLAPSPTRRAGPTAKVPASAGPPGRSRTTSSRRRAHPTHRVANRVPPGRVAGCPHTGRIVGRGRRGARLACPRHPGTGSRAGAERWSCRVADRVPAAPNARRRACSAAAATPQGSVAAAACPAGIALERRWHGLAATSRQVTSGHAGPKAAVPLKPLPQPENHTPIMPMSLGPVPVPSVAGPAPARVLLVEPVQVRPAGVAQPGRARSWICPGQTRAGRGARWTADCLAGVGGQRLRPGRKARPRLVGLVAAGSAARPTCAHQGRSWWPSADRDLLPCCPRPVLVRPNVVTGGARARVHRGLVTG